MKQPRPIQTLAAASLLAFLGSAAHAIILPPTDDTSGTKTNPPAAPKTTLTSANGTATTLPVSKTRTAFIQFNAGGAGLTAASVTKARLTL